jgi:hypothetical protein
VVGVGFVIRREAGDRAVLPVLWRGIEEGASEKSTGRSRIGLS